jgi:hypothetical protein
MTRFFLLSFDQQSTCIRHLGALERVGSPSTHFQSNTSRQATHARGDISYALRHPRWLLSIALMLGVTISNSANGQWIGKQTGCYATSIEANPNRPTVSNPAHVTQYGVLELEYGLDQLWLQEDIRSQTSFGGLLKFGLFCDIELRWNTTSFLSQTDATGTHNTFGDNWFGTEIRFHRQTTVLPTMAFSYELKLPTATTEYGLGTGRVDHSFTLGASEKLANFNFDFNLTQFLIGRTNFPGFDENQQLALAFAHPVYGGLQFVGEFYGDTQLNKTTAAFASSLWALTYTVVPRLVIDGGFESGLTSGGPHRHAFIGFTYSIANLYQGARRHRQ